MLCQVLDTMHQVEDNCDNIPRPTRMICPSQSCAISISNGVPQLDCLGQSPGQPGSIDRTEA
ncbi:hypothetical protein TanjilG_18153 [Lupinus angustifolius]|nr:hypothetical protein TanjilG_18153 [Lupinus angustifolius]